MALAPKQVDSATARKIAGASAGQVDAVHGSLNCWLASGVRLPLNQSMAIPRFLSLHFFRLPAESRKDFRHHSFNKISASVTVFMGIRC